MPAGPKHPSVDLKVVDEQGQPLLSFEALLLAPSYPTPSWTAGADGKILLGGTLLPTVGIVVRSDGYASACQQFSGEEREKLLRGESSITMQRGEKVWLHFQLPAGVTWPAEAMPETYFEPIAAEFNLVHNLAERKIPRLVNRDNSPPLDFNLLNVQPDDLGNFTLRLAADSPKFVVSINQPGFLQYFEAGPFTAKDVKDGVLSVEVPKPGALQVTFDLGDAKPDSLAFASARVQLSRLWQINKLYRIVSVQEDYLDGMLVKFSDLAPGKYVVSILTLSQGKVTPEETGTANSARFTDRKELELTSEQQANVDFHFVPFDEKAFRGNRTAVIRVETSAGQPAAGKMLKVDYVYPHYDNLPVYEGAIPDNGEVTLKDLTDVRAKELKVGPYIVAVDKQLLGPFSFSGSDGSENFKFHLPPQVGEVAPDIEFTNLANGKTTKLSDLRGKPVLLDFWATWCGPCQPALEKLDKEVADHTDAWKELTVIPISIDDEADTAKPHFEKKGWTHLNTYWSGAEGKVGWQAPAMRAFVLNSVPTCVLIDRDGKIIWLGNPVNEEQTNQLQASIQQALKQ